MAARLPAGNGPRGRRQPGRSDTSPAGPGPAAAPPNAPGGPGLPAAAAAVCAARQPRSDTGRYGADTGGQSAALGADEKKRRGRAERAPVINGENKNVPGRAHGRKRDSSGLRNYRKNKSPYPDGHTDRTQAARGSEINEKSLYPDGHTDTEVQIGVLVINNEILTRMGRAGFL